MPLQWFNNDAMSTKKFLIMPSPIFLEHQTFPDIKLKYVSLPKINAWFVVIPFAPFPYNLYTTTATQYGIKKWIDIGNILMNTLGIWLEHNGNTHQKNKKSPLPPPKKKFQRKKTTPLESSHCLHESSILKTICHYFHFINWGYLLTCVLLFFQFEEFFYNLICSFVLENHLGFLLLFF